MPNPLLTPTVLELRFSTLLPPTPELGGSRGTTKTRRDGSDITGLRKGLYWIMPRGLVCGNRVALCQWVIYGCHMNLGGLKPFLLPSFSSGWYRKRCRCTELWRILKFVSSKIAAGLHGRRIWAHSPRNPALCLHSTVVRFLQAGIAMGRNTSKGEVMGCNISHLTEQERVLLVRQLGIYS